MPIEKKIFKDFRGEIQVNKIQGKEFAVSFTEAGLYRGADIHAGQQFNVVLKGRLEATLRQNNKDIVRQYGANEMFIIPANTPHLFKAITDAILIEWKTGGHKTRRRYYEPYRKIVSQQFRKVNKINL